MSEKKVNIIIPSVEMSKELIICLKGINNLKYKNFMVTIVLDVDNKKKIQKFEFKINKIISGKINMSEKRNIGVKKFKSEYIAFIDSDAYPSINWLKNAISYLSDPTIHAVGGPDLPFKKQSYSEKITYLCHGSFFVSGQYKYRKFKKPKMICKDFLKSCNCIMKRSLFLKHGGMNKKRYIGEDKDLFEKLRKKVKNFKALFTPDVFIYHKDRPISKFLLQRLSFGTDIFTPSSNFWYYSLLSYMPTFVLLSTLLLLFFSEILLIYKFYLCLIIIIIPNIMIYLELRNYIKKFKDIVITALVINAVNILYAIGGLIALTGLKKLLEKKIYRFSRQK